MGLSRQEYWSGVPLPSPDLHLDGATYQHWSLIEGRSQAVLAGEPQILLSVTYSPSWGYLGLASSPTIGHDCREKREAAQKNGGLPWWSNGSNPPSNAGDVDSIPGQGTKIPHGGRQLSPGATTTEPMLHKKRTSGAATREKPACRN